jgi:hypothetical protein
MKVLVACESSGTVRRAFRERGHDAWSCDILPADDSSEYHIQGDATALLGEGWDLLIAHPPCTYLANSGVSWLHRDESRWEKMREGAALFRKFWESDIPRIAVENPIMHKYAKEAIGCGQQSQVIQPWMFGHMEQKATCLWLKGLPLLVPTDNVKEQTMALPDSERQRVHWLPPSKDRWKERSKTFDGIAQAMASQWG